MEWFGSSTFSLVERDSLKSLEEGIRLNLKQTKKKCGKKYGKFEQAIKEALQAQADKNKGDSS